MIGELASWRLGGLWWVVAGWSPPLPHNAQTQQLTKVVNLLVLILLQQDYLVTVDDIPGTERIVKRGREERWGTKIYGVENQR